MLLATVGGMMPAATGHFVGHYSLSTPAVIIPMLAVTFLSPAIYDRLRFGRFNRITLFGGIGLFLWANLRALVIGPSAIWHELMKTLLR